MKKSNVPINESDIWKTIQDEITANIPLNTKFYISNLSPVHPKKRPVYCAEISRTSIRLQEVSDVSKKEIRLDLVNHDFLLNERPADAQCMEEFVERLTKIGNDLINQKAALFSTKLTSESTEKSTQSSESYMIPFMMDQHIQIIELSDDELANIAGGIGSIDGWLQTSPVAEPQLDAIKTFTRELQDTFHVPVKELRPETSKRSAIGAFFTKLANLFRSNETILKNNLQRIEVAGDRLQLSDDMRVDEKTGDLRVQGFLGEYSVGTIDQYGKILQDDHLVTTPSGGALGITGKGKIGVVHSSQTTEAAQNLQTTFVGAKINREAKTIEFDDGTVWFIKKSNNGCLAITDRLGSSVGYIKNGHVYDLRGKRVLSLTRDDIQPAARLSVQKGMSLYHPSPDIVYVVQTVDDDTKHIQAVIKDNKILSPSHVNLQTGEFDWEQCEEIGHVDGNKLIGQDGKVLGYMTHTTILDPTPFENFQTHCHSAISALRALFRSPSAALIEQESEFNELIESAKERFAATGTVLHQVEIGLDPINPQIATSFNSYNAQLLEIATQSSEALGQAIQNLKRKFSETILRLLHSSNEADIALARKAMTDAQKAINELTSQHLTLQNRVEFLLINASARLLAFEAEHSPQYPQLQPIFTGLDQYRDHPEWDDDTQKEKLTELIQQIQNVFPTCRQSQQIQELLTNLNRILLSMHQELLTKETTEHPEYLELSRMNHNIHQQLQIIQEREEIKNQYATVQNRNTPEPIRPILQSAFSDVLNTMRSVLEETNQANYSLERWSASIVSIRALQDRILTAQLSLSQLPGTIDPAQRLNASEFITFCLNKLQATTQYLMTFGQSKGFVPPTPVLPPAPESTEPPASSAAHPATIQTQLRQSGDALLHFISENPMRLSPADKTQLESMINQMIETQNANQFLILKNFIRRKSDLTLNADFLRLFNQFKLILGHFLLETREYPQHLQAFSSRFQVAIATLPPNDQTRLQDLFSKAITSESPSDLIQFKRMLFSHPVLGRNPELVQSFNTFGVTFVRHSDNSAKTAFLKKIQGIIQRALKIAPSKNTLNIFDMTISRLDGTVRFKIDRVSSTDLKEVALPIEWHPGTKTTVDRLSHLNKLPKTEYDAFISELTTAHHDYQTQQTHLQTELLTVDVVPEGVFASESINLDELMNPPAPTQPKSPFEADTVQTLFAPQLPATLFLPDTVTPTDLPKRIPLPTGYYEILKNPANPDQLIIRQYQNPETRAATAEPTVAAVAPTLVQSKTITLVKASSAPSVEFIDYLEKLQKLDESQKMVLCGFSGFADYLSIDMAEEKKCWIDESDQTLKLPVSLETIDSIQFQSQHKIAPNTPLAIAYKMILLKVLLVKKAMDEMVEFARAQSPNYKEKFQDARHLEELRTGRYSLESFQAGVSALTTFMIPDMVGKRDELNRRILALPDAALIRPYLETELPKLQPSTVLATAVTKCIEDEPIATPSIYPSLIGTPLILNLPFMDRVRYLRHEQTGFSRLVSYDPTTQTVLSRPFPSIVNLFNQIHNPNDYARLIRTQLGTLIRQELNAFSPDLATRFNTEITQLVSVLAERSITSDANLDQAYQEIVAFIEPKIAESLHQKAASVELRSDAIFRPHAESLFANVQPPELRAQLIDAFLNKKLEEIALVNLISFKDPLSAPVVHGPIIIDGHPISHEETSLEKESLGTMRDIIEQHQLHSVDSRERIVHTTEMLERQIAPPNMDEIKPMLFQDPLLQAAAIAIVQTTIRALGGDCANLEIQNISFDENGNLASITFLDHQGHPKSLSLGNDFKDFKRSLGNRSRIQKSLSKTPEEFFAELQRTLDFTTQTQLSHNARHMNALCAPIGNAHPRKTELSAPLRPALMPFLTPRTDRDLDRFSRDLKTANLSDADKFALFREAVKLPIGEYAFCNIQKLVTDLQREIGQLAQTDPPISAISRNGIFDKIRIILEDSPMFREFLLVCSHLTCVPGSTITSSDLAELFAPILMEKDGASTGTPNEMDAIKALIKMLIDQFPAIY